MLLNILPATIKHAKELSLNLRPADAEEAKAQGIDPAKAVFQTYRQAYWKRTALLDDKVAAMWGLSGTLIGVSQPFLITSPECEKISPLSFMRIYKEELNELLAISPHLENYVDANYHGAIRALKIAGFKIAKPITLGPKESLFCRFSI